MKDLNEFIKESASLFDNWSGGFANNYISYNEGDTTFGELADGDKIYYHNVKDPNDNVVELTVKGKLIKRNGYYYIKVYDESDPKAKTITLDIGPVDTSTARGDKKYNPDEVSNSSICVSFDDNKVFGTNRDDVLSIAKSNVTSQINKINEEIKSLKTLIKSLKEKLDAII